MIVEVGAEFGVVAADTPGEIVGELVALFDPLDVGVRLASEISETRNIHGRVVAAGVSVL